LAWRIAPAPADAKIAGAVSEKLTCTVALISEFTLANSEKAPEYPKGTWALI